LVFSNMRLAPTSNRGSRDRQMKLLQRITRTHAGPAVLLIRILVGWVFVSEGIQKFLYPAQVGAGRFERIGIAAPHVMAPLVGAVEITCGSLILAGLLTRLAALPLLAVMVTALVSTKVPILLARGFGPFSLPKLSHYGFWSMLHEARTDISMVLGLIFLLIVGAGSCSLDARLIGNHPVRV
jgi:putative oxidoreductase